MPAIIDQNVCSCAPRCFAIPACPNDAIAFRVELGQVTIGSERCGECPGPCTNFCDSAAIKFTPSYDDLDLLQAQVLGTMTPEAIAAERTRRKKEAAERAEAEKTSLVVTLTSKNFEQFVMSAQVPVVIDFWADWCGPCKQMAPVLEQMARQYEGLMLFAKVDTDKEQVLSQRLGIQSLPTLLVVFRGQLVDRIVGAVPAQQLQARLYQLLAAVQQRGDQPAPGAGGTPAGPATGARPGPATGPGRPRPGGQPPRPNRPTIIRP